MHKPDIQTSRVWETRITVAVIFLGGIAIGVYLATAFIASAVLEAK